MGRPRRLLLCIAALAACSHAQIEVAPGSPRYAGYVREFERALSGPKTLSCSIDHFPPRMTYTFRFVGMFNATFPVRQFSGKGNSFGLGVRVTPEGGSGAPMYLAYASELPEIPAATNISKAEFFTSAGYYLGEGSYRVDALLIDGNGRACSKSWKERIKPPGKVNLSQAKGTVAALNISTWKGLSKKTGDRHLTVFLHAAPIYRRRYLSRLSAFDRNSLLQTLTSILDQSDFAHVRVVAFDLLGRRTLFRSDRFDAKAYERLHATLEMADYGRIDYKVLTQGPTESQLVAELIREELGRPEKADAVVFLGAEGYPARAAPLALEEAAADLPKSVYVAFARYQVPAEDVMYKVVKKSKGKRIMLLRPQDLVEAIKALNGKQPVSP